MPKIRSLVGLAVLGAMATGGVWWYRTSTEQARLIEEQERVIGALETRLDLVWAKELAADVRVNKLGKDPETGQPTMDLTFVQYEPGSEKPLFRRSMTLPGEEFYIDALVVQFERKFVEAGDGLKGKSMLVFRRAFGDRQKPVDGVTLYRRDDLVPIPELNQVDVQPSDFEQQLWVRFWQIANDPERAGEEGIAIAQGEAPHIKAVEGQVYKLSLRSSGGLQISPRLPDAVMNNDGKRRK